MKLRASVVREVRVRGLGRECSKGCQFYGRSYFASNESRPVCSLDSPNRIDGQRVRLAPSGETALRSARCIEACAQRLRFTPSSGLTLKEQEALEGVIRDASEALVALSALARRKA